MRKEIIDLSHNLSMDDIVDLFNLKALKEEYTYNFKWMGRPIIQYPQDMIAMQELIWEVKPDLIIEAGIAHGGSLIYYASILELIGEGGHILGIDIDIRQHNKVEIEKHSMFKNITMLEGSSINSEIIEKVKSFASKYINIMVLLDSNHTDQHVYDELKAYAELVTPNNYLVVFDTIIENMPKGFYDRSWDVGNNAMTGMKRFLEENKLFEIQTQIDEKIRLTCNPSGYLKRIK